MSKWISILAVMLVISLQAHSQADSGRLQGLGIPVAGDTLRLSYHPAGGPLAGKDNIQGIIYLFNNYRWVIDDILLKNNKGTWEGKYGVPGNCAFVAVKFITEEHGRVIAADNNNDFGYVATTVSRQGERLPGGLLAWGIFRKPSIQKAPGGYFDKTDISNEALEMWVRKEMEKYPQNMPKFFDSYLQMLKLSVGDAFPEKAPRNLEKFLKLPDLEERGYTIVQETYRFQLKNIQKADSVRNIILQKFPHGRTARFIKYNEVHTMPMDEKKLAALENFLHDFPVSEYRKDSTATQGFIYYSIYRLLAAAYFAKDMNDKLFAIIPDMDFATLTEVYRWNLDKAFIRGTLPIEKLYPVSQALINEMLKKKNDLSYMEDLRTPRQANEFAQEQLDNKLSIHIRMLCKMEKYAAALPYLAQLSAEGRYSNAALNEARISILENTGSGQMILSTLEMSIRANAATPAMLERLKQMYTTKQGKADGFDAYLESLKAADDVARTKEELKATLINEKIIPFQLTDMNGKKVNTDNWKDKIVVIDFWATWCFPCKMAFPGMQLAVDKYAGDPAVEFYFIATMEKSKTYKDDIKKYMQSSGYRFQVLYDDRNKETGGNDRVFKSMKPIFNSTAIPRKVIIKNGAVRYTAEGYGGSPSKLMDEISYVIELLKAEN